MLQSWRHANNPVPVITLTARDARYEKVDGFKVGADDYLDKPFHIEELLAHMHALLKRLHGRLQAPLRHLELILKEEQQTLCIGDGVPIALTAVEFRILRYMMLHSGQLLTKSQLLEHVYDMSHDSDSNVIELYINRLRQKMGKQY